MRIFHSDPMKKFTKNNWFWLALGILIVGIKGLNLPVMDVDASQYASISMEMLQNGSWLEVQHRHADYLDKPPLLFWTAAFSYLLFGINTWAYKLPSFLGAILGIYSVYRFSKLYYSKEVATLAAFILGSTVGCWLLLNDVRTDTLLMGMSATSVWMLAEYQLKKKYSFLIGTGLFVGLAMLAKGPIGLILPGAALAAHLVLSNNWRHALRWELLLIPLIIALTITPMCVGLYHQFDLHPEKIVNGKEGVSGLYFYFWEQSFGRITGENVWKNNTSSFYFLHVYAWAFLPWTLFLIPSLFSKFKKLLSNKLQLAQGEEAYSIGAFTLLFIALSLSKYKLPHYIFITLPWGAVITAQWAITTTKLKKWAIAQWVITLLLVLILALITGIVFPAQSPAKLLIWVPLIIGSCWILYKTYPALLNPLTYWQLQTGTGLLIGLILNAHFYPSLLPFQSTTAAGRYFHEKNIPIRQRAQMGYGGHALDFYSKSIIPHLNTAEEVLDSVQLNGPIWIYTREGGREQLDAAGIPYEIVAQFKHYQPALLSMPFLNPKTRESKLIPVEIVKVTATK